MPPKDSYSKEIDIIYILFLVDKVIFLLVPNSESIVRVGWVRQQEELAAVVSSLYWQWYVNQAVDLPGVCVCVCVSYCQESSLSSWKNVYYKNIFNEF